MADEKGIRRQARKEFAQRIRRKSLADSGARSGFSEKVKPLREMQDFNYKENISTLSSSVEYAHLADKMMAQAKKLEKAGLYNDASGSYGVAWEAYDLACANGGSEAIGDKANYAREQRYHVDQLADEIRSKGEKDLTSKLTPVIATLGLLSGIFFLSNNITGNAIADFSTKTSSFLGAGLLVIGLVAGFFWIKKKNKKEIVSQVSKPKISRKKK